MFVYGNNMKYAGEWSNGLRHGTGQMETPSGVYDGSWHADRRHGRGVEKLASGEVGT